MMNLTVTNDGVPVKPEKRELIFNMFTRLESSQPGTGIGLSYARSLANMLDGTLAMGEALTENQFILRLPINGEADSDDNKETEEIQNLEHILRQNEKSLSIMLVDDNAEMLSFLEKKLIANNYRVIRATNGEEALRLLKSEYVDILISDVMMPVMDGYELTKAIKSDVKFSHIPIILLTAKTQMEDKLTGLEIGASAYIEKPFAIEYLLATISSIVSNREHLRLRLEKNPVTKASGSNLTKVDEEFLRRLNEIIQANFDNPDFSIDDVIYQMGVGRTTFYRKIKGLLDLSPYDYIRIERLKRAATLFGEGHTNVSEVCYMVGFSSPGYFSKCFQKQFGVSPKEYIQQNKSAK
jgi:DNA-binding response OmpR family regulator